MVTLAVGSVALFSPADLTQTDQTLDRVSQRGRLVVAVDANYPPLSYTDVHGTLIGFDVDVGRLIAERMGVSVAYETPSWPAVLSGRWQGRWDLSVGSITPTEERQRVLDFPATYYSVPAALVVHAANRSIRSAADAAGKKLGVPQSSTYDRYLTQTLSISVPGTPAFTYQLRDAQITRFPDEANTLNALAEGDGARIDAALMALPPAMAAIRNGLPLRVAAQPVFIEPLAVAIEKGSPAFAHRVAQAVDSLRADGSLSRLSIQWFGADFSQ
jgi:polar amino acid transport system substrate-binding protein